MSRSEDLMKDQFVRIRKAKVNDYSACLPLFTLLYHGDTGPNFKIIFEEFINNEDSIVLLAEHSGKVIGILVGSYHLDIDWEGNVARIDALIVDRAFRRMGIGRRLVRYFITKAKNGGCKAVRSRVNRKNTIAQFFYKNQGFTRANTYEYFLDFREQHKR